jgi:hypothetical protein
MDNKFCALTTPSISEEQRQLFLNGFFSGFHQLKERSTQTATLDATETNPISSFEGKAPKSRRQNKLAALSFHDVESVERKVDRITHRHQFDPQEKKVWGMIRAYNELAQEITSSDLPSDDADSALLVRLTQNFADKTLDNPDKTWLDKILEISIHTKKTGFGNCQEKAFFGFAALVLESQKRDSLINTLRLATFNNHFIVIVNEEILMDPWLNLAFPLESGKNNIGYVFQGFGKLVDYFTFHSNGECVTHQVTEGSSSCKDIYSQFGFSKSYQMLLANKNYFNLPDFPVYEQEQMKKRQLDEKDLAATKNSREKLRKMTPTPPSTSGNGLLISQSNPDEIEIEEELDAFLYGNKESVNTNSYSTPTSQAFSSLFPIASFSDSSDDQKPAGDSTIPQFHF